MKLQAHSRTGFALVLTLIMLALLSIAVVGFLSSSTVDRSTAHAFANKARAELAAQAAANAAISLVTQNISRYPDSATVWEGLQAPTGTDAVPKVEGTMLYFTKDGPNVPSAPRYVLPLMSTGLNTADAEAGNGDLPELPAGARLFAAKKSALGTQPWTNDNSIDINRRRSNDDEEGWVGASPQLGRVPLRAKWVNVEEDVKRPNYNSSQPKKDEAVDRKVTSRYAFWVEDESFRLNLNELGANARGAQTFSPGKVPSEMPYQGLMEQIIRTNFQPSAATNSAAALFGARNNLQGKRLLDLRSFNEVNSEIDLLGDKSKFLGTVYSGALNQTRSGTQRVNLNGLGFDQTNQSDDDIVKGIRRIMETIKYENVDDKVSHAPKFHQRFYRNSTQPQALVLNREEVDVRFRDLYLAKVAANIKDYIDPDGYPTMLQEDPTSGPGSYTKFVLAPRVAPEHAFGIDGALTGAPNPMWAQGKDSAPYAQEVMTRLRGLKSGSNFEIEVDYYIEFWNMTDKDVYAGTAPDTNSVSLNGADIKISGQFGFVGTRENSRIDLVSQTPAVDIGRSSGPLRDMVLDLVNNVRMGSGAAAPRGVVFPAGSCTVITTAPDGISFGTQTGNGPVYICNLTRGYRKYKGNLPSGVTGFRAAYRNGTQRGQDFNEDYETDIVLRNSQGYLDSVPYAFSFGGYADEFTSSNLTTQLYSGSLYGNVSGNIQPSQTGDPRTTNEQMTLIGYLPGSFSTSPEQSRYWNSQKNHNLAAPNSFYLDPANLSNPWPDYYKGWNKTATSDPPQLNVRANQAPMFVLNQRLQSIGQLGDVFDPARYKGVGAIDRSRGGGRTFKIGQFDDRVDNGVNSYPSASRQWASHRMTDLFSTSNDLETPGLINVNGIRRDDGAALKAACYGMTMQSVGRVGSTFQESNPALKTAPGETKGVKAVVEKLKTRLNQDQPNNLGPLMERGEIGNLDLFSTSSELQDGVSMNTTFDRSREEFCRRLMNLITTRGNVFSVYAVGQSITEPPNARAVSNVTAETVKKHATATHQLKVTFKLIPKQADGTLLYHENETWDPTKVEERRKRFNRVDHYDVQILQVSH